MQRIDVDSGGTKFSIEYNAFTDEIVIDGVRCSAEVIRDLIVAPRLGAWLRFERNGNAVTVTQQAVAEGAQ